MNPDSMMTFKTKFRLWFLAGLLLVSLMLLAMGAGGCAAIQEGLGLEPAAGDVVPSTQPSPIDQMAANNEARIEELEGFLANLPADHVSRPAYQYELQWRRVAKTYAPPPGKPLDLENPALDSLAGLVPGGVIGLAALRLIFVNRKKAKQFRQVVQSIEAAFPNRSLEQKQALSAIQDQDTRDAVQAAKAGT